MSSKKNQYYLIRSIEKTIQTMYSIQMPPIQKLHQYENLPVITLLKYSQLCIPLHTSVKTMLSNSNYLLFWYGTHAELTVDGWMGNMRFVMCV
jgi:hypothetical protein